MYADQVWLDNLTLVTLLTINSLPFKHDVNLFSMLVRDNMYVLYAYPSHKISEGSDVFSYSMVTLNFFFSARVKALEGNYLS